MSRLTAKYRSWPPYVALPFAAIASLILSGIAYLGFAYFSETVLTKIHSIGLGDAIAIVLLGVPGVTIPVFVVSITTLVNLYRRATWRTPTLALGFCALVVIFSARPLSGFNVPSIGILMMLATGIIAWIACCWFIRPKDAQN